LIGALDGRERFLASNLLQLFSGAVFQVFPLAIAYWHGPDLKWLIGSAVISRVVASGPFLLACAKCVPLRGWPTFDRHWIRELFSFGGWLTLSSLVNPFLTILDRFVIGAVRGATAVTYYTIPNQFATKFSILPGSVTRTLFPRLAMNEETSNDLAQRAVVAVAAVTMPLASIGILAIAPFFQLWLGPATARLSSGAGEIMILGVWFNGIASIPFTLLLAQGRPASVAKIHAAQVVPFIAVLWLGLRLGGVEGAALAWTLRGGIDALLFFWMTGVPRKQMLALAQPTALLILSIVGARAAGESLLFHALAAATVIPLTCLWAMRAVPDKFRQYVDTVSAALKVRIRSYSANT
jgi:O-antigen/teichoic acid export membrane protein